LLLDRSTGVWIHEFDAFVSEILAQNSRRRPVEPAGPIAGTEPLRATVYLADQNPGHDRSFGISRMSQVVLEALHATGSVRFHTIASETSQHAPPGIGTTRVLPWGTRRKSVRLLTDHLYPLFANRGETADLHYFPKGYLPWFSGLCRPSVVTIHDTIIQYDEDRYPEWRSAGEYAYWAWMLKHTLRAADLILTVSEASKSQILAFMDRHRIPRKEIIVTFEPCVYESLPQPVEPPKENYVIHLASAEPHKRSAHLIRWWHEAESAGRDLPMLHLIGSVPREVEGLLASSRSIVKRPFLEDHALQAAYREARALILPSEIEGFGLPALEAYYLGTPVCYVAGTSVAEVLGVATGKGAFTLDDPDTLVAALEEVVAMSPAEVRDCGLKLRETYAASKVAARMLDAFRGVAKVGRAVDPNLCAAP
jgi:glycosyltransferase involved in cell wall biosynthesis